MKNQVKQLLIALALLAAVNLQLSTAFAQGTAFTYQGQLQNNGSPASGTYNLTFTLFNDTNAYVLPVAGPVTNNGVLVANGLFTVTIDFGSSVWNGQTNWLQIGVETNGVNSFTILMPDQQLTPTPYAIYAESAGGLPGLVVQPNTNGAPNLIGGSSVNFVSSGVAGATIGGGGATNFSGSSYSNSVTANFGTVGGGFGNTASGSGAFIGGGALNTSGLAATVGGGQQNNASGILTFIGGGASNTAGGIGSFVGGGGYDGTTESGNSALGNASVIGGGLGNNIQSGGTYAFIGGGQFNTNSSIWSTIGGGDNIVIQSGGLDCVIGGGGGNTISSNNSASAIAGGSGNTIQANDANSFIGGGYLNNIASGASFSVISGGLSNSIQINAFQSTIGGGQQNIIQAVADHSFIGGGEGNVIVGSSTLFVYGTIGGGAGNTIMTNNEASAIAGGNSNTIGANVYYASIGGGDSNQATNSYATVPGGANNLAGGQFSFAAGDEAQAANNGAFVWADAEGTPFSSTTPNQFNVRADGGVRFVTGGAGMTIDGQPVLASGSGSGLTIQQNSDGAPNLIGGSPVNFVSGGVEGATIGGGGETNYLNLGIANPNSVTGNFGTVGGGSVNTAGFVATVGGGYDNTASGAYAFIGGGYHSIAGGQGATVGGGGWDGTSFSGNSAIGNASMIGGGLGNNIPSGGTYNFIGGGEFNTNAAISSTISGGADNNIQAGANSSTIAGGGNNTVQANSTSATIGGGAINIIQGSAYQSTIAGGNQNVIQSSADQSTIAGGNQNVIQTSAFDSTIGGGNHNTNSGAYATIPGGEFDVAGANSFAAGSYAQATNAGAFVWSDNSTTSVFGSTNNNSFSARAAGGFQFCTSSSGRGGAGLYVPPGGNSWVTVSDRNAKKDFQPVDYQAVLDKLARVPIEQWHYKWESDKDTPNIGPMAQDFIAAFYPGRDDKGISTLEFDGVELAAIQGLNQKLNEKDAEIQNLEQQNGSLTERLNKLEAAVKTLAEKN